MASTADDPFLQRKDWPEFFKEEFGFSPCSAKTFAKKGTTGGSPPYVVVGGKALSRPSWLRPWLEAQIPAPRTSTSSEAA